MSDRSMSAAAGAGSGDAPDPGEGQPPAARPSPSRRYRRQVAQLRVLAPLPEGMAAIVAEMEAEQLVGEAERYCREALEHGRGMA